MSNRNKRRTLYIFLTVLFCAVAYYYNMLFLKNIQSPYLYSGWLLVSLVVLLISFNFRKKLSFLPLGSAYIWSQIHIYLGLLASFVFLMHIDFQLPNGNFEIIFASILSLTIISGITGLILSRLLPRIMRQHSENVVFERIPALRVRLVQEAEQEFERAITNNSDQVLLSYFTDRVLPFLQSPNNSLYNFFTPRKIYRSWNTEIDNLQCLLNQKETEISQSLRQIIYKKIGLDFQQKGRSILRYWLYWHIPLSYILIFLSLAHIVLVYGFTETI